MMPAARASDDAFHGGMQKQKSKSNFGPRNFGCIKKQVYSYYYRGREDYPFFHSQGWVCSGLVTSNDSSGKDMPGEESGQCQSKDNLVGTHTFFLNSSFARKLSAEKVYVLSGCMSL